MIQHGDKLRKKCLKIHRHHASFTKINNTKMHHRASVNNLFTVISLLRFVRNFTFWLASWLYWLLFYNILKTIFFWNHKNVNGKFNDVIYRRPKMLHLLTIIMSIIPQPRLLTVSTSIFQSYVHLGDIHKVKDDSFYLPLSHLFLPQQQLFMVTTSIHQIDELLVQ